MEGPVFGGEASDGLAVYPSHEEAIQAVLADVARKAAASLILLTTRSGHFIAATGDHAGVDKTALGSLIAADLAASQQIARMLDPAEAHQMILREGERYNMLVSEAGERLVLLAVVHRKEPLGWVRMLVREAAQRLAEIARGMPEPSREAAPAQPNKELADLIGRALDELWTE